MVVVGRLGYYWLKVGLTICIGWRSSKEHCLVMAVRWSSWQYWANGDSPCGQSKRRVKRFLKINPF